MARELGLNAKKFGKIAHHKQEPWKAPLSIFIEGLYYYKRFGKRRPDEVKSIEQLVKIQEKKKAERRAHKQKRQSTGSAPNA